MSKRAYADWCNEQLAVHTKQAQLLRGKEKKAHDLRVWHEESIAHFKELLEG